MDDARATSLPLKPVSAGQARRFVKATLRDWDMPAVQDEALLLTSELVTNALVHAATTAILLRLRRLPDGVRVEVTDTSATPPVQRQPGTSSDGGRGLVLVASYARAWGTEPGRSGKTVWFELDTRA